MTHLGINISASDELLTYVYLMLRVSVGLMVVLLVAALFGFGGSIATGAVSTVKVLFYTLLALVVLSLLVGPTLFRRR